MTDKYSFVSYSQRCHCGLVV